MWALSAFRVDSRAHFACDLGRAFCAAGRRRVPFAFALRMVIRAHNGAPALGSPAPEALRERVRREWAGLRCCCEAVFVVRLPGVAGVRNGRRSWEPPFDLLSGSGVRACVPKGRHLCARKRALYALPAMSVYRSRGVLSVRKRTSCRDGVMYGVFRGLADCGVLLVRGESRGDSTELEGSLGSFFCASMLDTARGTARSRVLRGGSYCRRVARDARRSCVPVHVGSRSDGVSSMPFATVRCLVSVTHDGLRW